MVFPRIFGGVVSSLDTVVATVEIIAVGDDSVAAEVEFSKPVNPEGSRLSMQSAVQPRGIPRPARVPLRPSILPAPLRRGAQTRDTARPPGALPPPLRPAVGWAILAFSPPLPLYSWQGRPLSLAATNVSLLACLAPKAEDVSREAGVAAVEARKAGGMCRPCTTCSTFWGGPVLLLRVLDLHFNFSPL